MRLFLLFASSPVELLVPNVSFFSLSAPVCCFFLVFFLCFFETAEITHKLTGLFCPSLHHRRASPSLAAVSAPATCLQSCDVWLLPAAGAGAALAPDYKPCYHRGFVPRSPEGSGFHVQPLPVASLDWNPGASGMAAAHFMD